MSDSVLLRFLSGGLINVGGDDTKLEKLKATSNGVAGMLKKHSSRVPNCALIAFDPEAPPDDPVILEVLSILQEVWPTYVNTFASTPVQVLRAIILDALVSSAQEDERVAVAVAACARNVLPFMETGNELSIWVDVVDKIEDSVDRRAEEEWSTPADIDIPAFATNAIAPIKVGNSVVKVDRDSFRQSLSNAAQGSGQFYQGNSVAWAQSFASLLTDPIGDVLDKISANAKVNAVDILLPLQELGNAVSSYVSSAVKAFGTATTGLQRRTNLIWWKQSLYSLSKRYRAFPRTVAASLMAFDLYQQIPMFSPARPEFRPQIAYQILKTICAQTLRRNFTFRLSFGPSDLVEAPPPLFVCTPANLAARWSHFPLISSNGTSDRSSPAVNLLIGEGQRPAGLQPLIKALGIQIATFPELAVLNRLHDLYSAGTLNLDIDVAKVRLIDTLSRGEKNTCDRTR